MRVRQAVEMVWMKVRSMTRRSRARRAIVFFVCGRGEGGGGGDGYIRNAGDQNSAKERNNGDK